MLTPATAFHPPPKNLLLAALPREEYERLLPHFERVHLGQGEVLYGTGDTVRHAYFLTGGMISLLSVTEDGGMIEVAMVGREGLAGIPVLLRMSEAPYTVMVQISADALKIRAERLRDEFDRAGRFQYLLLRYIHTVIAQISQSAVCHHFHTVDQRLCRWLLVTRDRVQSGEFRLTQEFIAHMLGVPRTSVTAIAGSLRKAGLIGYSRGRIEILDPQGLEAAACECYRNLREELSRFLAA